MAPVIHRKVAVANPGITEFLVSEVFRMASADLPGEVIEVARHSVLDWFGVAIAGANEALVRALLEEARDQGGTPACTVVWHGDRTSPTYAALINGSSADAHDFADVNLAMRGHSTPAVVAASLALAERSNASGLELLRAIVAGIELECRVGLLLQVPHLREGFHPTGNIAIFGATAASCRMLGLSRVRCKHALGIAATQAAGLTASSGTMCKPFHSGKAAANGILSANLAGRNFIGRPNAIEAPKGFLEAHATGPREDLLYASAGRYLILDTIFKSHAACVHTHSSIENVLKLKREHGISPEQVKRLHLQVSPRALGTANIEAPSTGLEAKFSLRASAAMALLGDNTMSIASFNDERAKSADLISLRDRINASACEDLVGGNSIATIELSDGRTFTSTMDVYRPLRDLVLQRENVSRKFMSLVAPVLGERPAMELRELIFHLDKLNSVKRLLVLTVDRNQRRARRRHGTNVGDVSG